MASGQQIPPSETKQNENPPPYTPSQQHPPAERVQQFVQQNPQGFVQLNPYPQGYSKPQQGGFSDISSGYCQPMPQQGGFNDISSGYGQPMPQQGGFNDISRGYGYGQPMPQTSSMINTSTVVVNQPQSSQMLILNPAPNSNMLLAILSCFFCCWLLGIGAIIASAMSQSQSSEMRYDEAKKSANISRILSIASLIIGIVIYILIVVLSSVAY